MEALRHHFQVKVAGCYDGGLRKPGMGAFRSHLSEQVTGLGDTGLIASRYHSTMRVAVRIPKFCVDVKPVV